MTSLRSFLDSREWKTGSRARWPWKPQYQQKSLKMCHHSFKTTDLCSVLFGFPLCTSQQCTQQIARANASVTQASTRGQHQQREGPGREGTTSQMMTLPLSPSQARHCENRCQNNGKGGGGKTNVVKMVRMRFQTRHWDF